MKVGEPARVVAATGQATAVPPKTGAACHRVMLADVGDGPGSANTDANNGSVRAWTAVKRATARTAVELGSRTDVDGCGQPSFDS